MSPRERVFTWCFLMWCVFFAAYVIVVCLINILGGWDLSWLN